VVDGLLLGAGGHWLNQALDIRSAFAQRGYEVSVLGPRNGDAVVRAAGVRPVLPAVPSLSVPFRGRLWTLRAALPTWSALLRQVRARDAYVIFPSARPIDIVAVALWCAATRSRPRAVILNLMTGGAGAELRLYRFCARWLWRLDRGRRVAVTCGSEGHRAALSRRGFRDVRHYPMFQRVPDPVGLPETGDLPEPGLPVVVCTGRGAPDKGLELLPGIVAAAAGRGARFVLDVHAFHMDSGLQARLRELPGVELDVRALEPAAYFARLARAAIVLMPYDPRAYRSRTSGLFVEALALGKPVVVPANTWMAEHLEAGHGAGVTFAAWDAASIATALSDALERLPALSARARAGAAAWRAMQGADAFVERLLADEAAHGAGERSAGRR
jgi:glycosyltransferase involved in cell wall biosynthesis